MIPAFVFSVYRLDIIAKLRYATNNMVYTLNFKIRANTPHTNFGEKINFYKITQAYCKILLSKKLTIK